MRSPRSATRTLRGGSKIACDRPFERERAAFPRQSTLPATTLYTKNPSVIETDLEHELILLDPGSGEMFSLNDTGRRVWRALPSESVESLAGQLVAAMEVDRETAERDVRSLLDALLAARLVASSPG